MQLWKLVGLAGLAGVAASGAVIARDERKRNAYAPDEVRSRLHQRAAAASNEAEVADPTAEPDLDADSDSDSAADDDFDADGAPER